MRVLKSFLLLCCLCACEKADNTFAGLPARFTWTNVLEVPELRIACEAQGEYCMIYRSSSVESGTPYFVFQNIKTTTERPCSAIQGYSGFHLGVSGLIVGQPLIPFIERSIICYDAVCRYCYDNSIYKRLTFKSNSEAKCPTCGRVYDLNNWGRTDTGERLLMYRASYSAASHSLVISN